MAFDTFVAPLVRPVDNAHQRTTIAVWLVEERMASQAKRSVFVERQELIRIRMIDRRAVAIFTLDRLVR